MTRLGTLGIAAALAAGQLARAHDPLAGDYSRQNPLDVRVLTWNTEARFIAAPGADPEFNRVLQALDPDVIVFQEIDADLTTGDLSARLNAILPTAGGWRIHFGLLAGTRNALCARHPLTLTRTDTIPASSTRGVTIGLVDLPDAAYPTDLYLMGVHLKCCGDAGGSEDAQRQDSTDAIANWLGDARGVVRPSGNRVVLPLDTPMVVLGDFNFVGGPQPELTLRGGDIQDQPTYGSDVKGDWDATDITDLVPADPFTGSTITWQGSSSFPPSRLDRFYYTDAAATIAARFVFNTSTMTPAARTAAGVQAGDTLPANASDHLPVVADFRIAVACEGDADGDADVDLDDLLLVLASFGQPAPAADFDGDGTVDLDDLLVLLARFGQPC